MCVTELLGYKGQEENDYLTFFFFFFSQLPVFFLERCHLPLSEKNGHFSLVGQSVSFSIASDPFWQFSLHFPWHSPHTTSFLLLSWLPQLFMASSICHLLWHL